MTERFQDHKKHCIVKQTPRDDDSGTALLNLSAPLEISKYERKIGCPVGVPELYLFWLMLRLLVLFHSKGTNFESL